MRMDSSFEFCRKNVQQYDSDGYLVSLFVKEPQPVWAVLAFHSEIAKTRFVVSEPTLGLIRLQWWRDEIGKIYDGQAHAAGEVLDALAVVIRDYEVPQELLEAMIVVREIEMRGEQPEGVDGALSFIDMMMTPLLTLLVQVSGGMWSRNLLRRWQ